MRINKYIAQSTELSRRAADIAVEAGRVTVDGQMAINGTEVKDGSQVKLDGRIVRPQATKTTIMLNKPMGYVCSRNGQGNKTIYDLLPKKYHNINPIGRLDKDSSGLILMTDDGDLANQLAHPSYSKSKIYQVALDKPLQPLHQQMISDHGVTLADGLSRFLIQKEADNLIIVMREGRNRQIRRTFAALGYAVVNLHRTNFGPYTLNDLPTSEYKELALA